MRCLRLQFMLYASSVLSSDRLHFVVYLYYMFLCWPFLLKKKKKISKILQDLSIRAITVYRLGLWSKMGNYLLEFLIPQKIIYLFKVEMIEFSNNVHNQVFVVLLFFF